MKIKSKLLIIYLSLIISLCNGCAITPPPLEFAPKPSIIENAIALSIEYEYHELSSSLKTKLPKFDIDKINVNKIEPRLFHNLAIYHLEGTYQIKLTTNKLKNKIIKNKFKIDLQREKQGKTWRLIVPYKDNEKMKYFAYKIY